jgi:hypothetical protein
MEIRIQNQPLKDVIKEVISWAKDAGQIKTQKQIDYINIENRSYGQTLHLFDKSGNLLFNVIL